MIRYEPWNDSEIFLEIIFVFRTAGFWAKNGQRKVQKTGMFIAELTQ